MLHLLIRKGVAKSKDTIFGENHTIHGKGALSIHAEQHALTKFLNSKYSTKKVDLVVIRLSKLGHLGESRPCKHCIYRLQTACIKYNITIQYVYYSTSDGKIIREKFSELKSSDSYISSGNKKKIINK